MSRRKPEKVEEETRVKEKILCSSCKRNAVQLQEQDIKLMVHHKKPLIAFCVSCKKTWPENAKPYKGQEEEEEED